MNYQIVILAVFILFALKEAINGGLFNKKTEESSDSIVEAMSTVLLFAVSQPFALFSAAFLMSLAFPQYEGALADTSIFLQILLLLIFDDLMQYWWHRASHTFMWLYNLHRAHHNAKYMSVRIVFRNNFFYYAMMPSLWFSGALIYLGLGWVYAFYLIVKLTVIIGAHSEWKWDKPLYENQYTSKFMWIVERLISTPSTHSAHHGYNDEDGVTTYKGNYGNLLFLWDVIFGTAKITRRYPVRYGVKGMLKAQWQEQLFWPLVPSALQKKRKAKKKLEQDAQSPQ
ncbi:sterol desaturase family protein [Alteromonas sp. W364]|uniref:sterol desaturase family protein n=1 Tax=Alteromonas sp. W364 TaxID=3075610 RepID=UPI0028842878|nr:sterol desaturase family protein [Alteromonas sp. W364]MDT0629290.1 sterol desaturase family protein [Alteromonas sp. W364]